MVHIQPQTNRCRDVTYDRLGNSEHAERILRKRILRQPDESTHQQSADRAATHQCEVNRDNKWQLEIGQKLKKQWNINLEQDCRQRNEKQNPCLEARNLCIALGMQQDVVVAVSHRSGEPPAVLGCDWGTGEWSAGGTLRGGF